jgi:hypothetical protein
MNRSRTVLTAAVSVLIGFPFAAMACRCANGTPDPAHAYQRAHVVVLGTALELSQDAATQTTEARIAVNQAWKKDTDREIKVTTRTTCAYPFQTGQDYVLFLYRADSSSYFTAKCVGNRTLKQADQALMWLRRHGRLGKVSRLPASEIAAQR